MVTFKKSKSGNGLFIFPTEIYTKICNYFLKITQKVLLLNCKGNYNKVKEFYYDV